MSSVERLIEYGNLTPEGIYKKDHKQLTPEWPNTNSGIEVQNLTFKYRPELEPVLNSISFKL